MWSGEWLRMPVAIKVFSDDYDESHADDSIGSGAAGGGTSGSRGGPERRLESLITEAEVLAQIRHPNVCLFLALCIERKVCVVSELYSGGSVYDFLHGPKPRRFRRMQALDLVKDVARGMVGCLDFLLDAIRCTFDSRNF